MAKGKSGGGKSGGKSGGSKGSGGKTRSAISGRYVTAAHGRRSPRTTVRERLGSRLRCGLGRTPDRSRERGLGRSLLGPFSFLPL